VETISTYILNEGYETPQRASAAKGCHIKIDGKWLIDTQMGAGTFILGHGFSTPAIKEALEFGTLYICPNVFADTCGELLTKATGFKHFIFANSGMEATMKAMRIARAYTRRDKVAIFQGCWHGSQDYNLVLYSKGIPSYVKDSVSILDFSEQAFDVICKERPACVMVEPVQSSCPVDRRAFLRRLRQVCSDSGVLLCFDEVISGFRLSLGGASELFDIVPDLVCYGKIAGGGFPVGVIGGNKVLEIVKSGVRMGGTFSANPLTAIACATTLRTLLETKPYAEIQENFNILLNLKSKHVRIQSIGNMGRLMFTTRPCSCVEERDEFELPKKTQESMIGRLRELGVYLGNNHLILPSILHTKSKMEAVKSCLESL